MTTHLDQEEFILSYYGEPQLGAERRGHLERCQECIAELTALAAVLDRVTPVEAPEPGDDYEARVWDRLQWRLRGEKKRERFTWVKALAVAATVIVAFLGGVLWKSSSRQTGETIATTTTSPVSTKPADDSKTRILLVVVGEHFDQSERMLVELTNLTPKGNTDGTTDITATRERAEELIDSNRLYRRTALDRGEDDVATLLDELEPVLMQIAHAPSQVSEEELRAMQKRVETKGLVFKLRVVRADVKRTAGTPTNI